MNCKMFPISVFRYTDLDCCFWLLYFTPRSWIFQQQRLQRLRSLCQRPISIKFPNKTALPLGSRYVNIDSLHKLSSHILTTNTNHLQSSLDGIDGSSRFIQTKTLYQDFFTWTVFNVFYTKDNFYQHQTSITNVEICMKHLGPVYKEKRLS